MSIRKRENFIPREDVPKKRPVYAYALIAGAVLTVLASIFGSSLLFKYGDLRLPYQVVRGEKAELESYVYKYKSDMESIAAEKAPEINQPANQTEKLFIAANALKNRQLPHSDFIAKTRDADSGAGDGAGGGMDGYGTGAVVYGTGADGYGTGDNGYGTGAAGYKTDTAGYGLFSSYKNQAAGDADRDAAIEILVRELDILYGMGAIPSSGLSVAAGDYDIDWFSAVDMADPLNNVPLILYEFGETQQLSRKRELITDCCIDADMGKIISLSYRTDFGWDNYDPDTIAAGLGRYLGIYSVPIGEAAAPAASAASAASTASAASAAASAASSAASEAYAAASTAASASDPTAPAASIAAAYASSTASAASAAASASDPTTSAAYSAVEYDISDTLVEGTQFFRKYAFDCPNRADGAQITVTIGYFEGINEYYVKIS